MKCPCCGHVFFPDSGPATELDWVQKLVQSQHGGPNVEVNCDRDATIRQISAMYGAERIIQESPQAFITDAATRQIRQ